MKNDNLVRFLCFLVSFLVAVSMRIVVINYTMPPSQPTVAEQLDRADKPRKRKGKN